MIKRGAVCPKYNVKLAQWFFAVVFTFTLYIYLDLLPPCKYVIGSYIVQLLSSLSLG